MYKIRFDNKINCAHYYNNCIYNCRKAGQVLDFKEYNVSAKLGIIYIHIIEYYNFLLLSEHQKLLVLTPARAL